MMNKWVATVLLGLLIAWIIACNLQPQSPTYAQLAATNRDLAVENAALKADNDTYKNELGCVLPYKSK